MKIKNMKQVKEHMKDMNMKRLFRRNQIIITTLAVMIAAAGYLNYAGKKDLARALHLNSPVSSYTIRHSWATTAKYRGVPIEMISELLGHKSIKTTQTYLKGFNLQERTKVNKMNLSYVKNCCIGR